MTAALSSPSELLRTPLYPLHHQLGAKIVPFAGYDMPLQYEGILGEHLHVRSAAGLFDVSHMGVIRLEGDVTALEELLPTDLQNLPEGQVRYSLLMNEEGGVEDDLLIMRQGDAFLAVINASRKDHDIAYMRAHLQRRVMITPLPRAILALQGPLAATVLDSIAPGSSLLSFMTSRLMPIAGHTAVISRTGYTGEDGFEIIISEESALDVAQHLLENHHVRPIGLGARDSLRLEAGLCLYGHELSREISPVEAGLLFAIPKSRRTSGAFLGVETILSQLENGPSRKRVGLLPVEKAIPREGMEIMSHEGHSIGLITSGCHSPTLNHPIAIGYVPSLMAQVGREVFIPIRGQLRSAKVVPLPFVPHQYNKG